MCNNSCKKKNRNTMIEINSIIKLALLAFIFRNLMGIISSIIKIPTGFYDPSLIIFSVIQGIIMIVILINMLRVKTWALYAFFIFQILNAVLLTLINDGSFMDNLIIHFVTAVVLSGLMSAILLIRKNGISAWKAFLDKDSPTAYAPIRSQINQQVKPIVSPTTVVKVLEDGRTAVLTASDDKEAVFDIYDLHEELEGSDDMPLDEFYKLQDYAEEPDVELDDDGFPISENRTEEPVLPENSNEESPDLSVPQESESAIPVDENGKTLYHKIPVEKTIADINDGSLDPEEVDAFVSANKTEAEKLLKKIAAKSPKVSTDKAKYLAEKQAWQENMKDAQARVDYWKEVETQIQSSRIQPGDKTVELTKVKNKDKLHDTNVIKGDNLLQKKKFSIISKGKSNFQRNRKVIVIIGSCFIFALILIFISYKCALKTGYKSHVPIDDSKEMTKYNNEDLSQVLRSQNRKTIKNVIENERWDKDNYIYANYKYGFHWALPPDIKWTKTIGTEKHTIFKVSAANGGIVAFVNANVLEKRKKQTQTFWDVFEKYKSLTLEMDNKIYDATGEKITERTFDKYVFCGKKSIKTTYVSIINDDRFFDPLITKTINYIYLYNNTIYTVSVKMNTELYKKIEKDINIFFKGYGITKMH